MNLFGSASAFAFNVSIAGTDNRFSSFWSMSLQQDYLVNKQMHVHRISELSKFTKMNEQHFKTRNGRLKRNDLYLVVLFVPYLPSHPCLPSHLSTGYIRSNIFP